MNFKSYFGILLILIASISFLLAGTELVTRGPLIAAGLSLAMLVIIISVFAMIYGLLTSKRTLE
jgi:hypothetical protein